MIQVPLGALIVYLKSKIVKKTIKKAVGKTVEILEDSNGKSDENLEERGHESHENV